MGHKVHPTGFRLGITQEWRSRWYSQKHYTEFMQEDVRIRRLVMDRTYEAGVSRVDIERWANDAVITVHTGKPGIVIGRGGQRVDELRRALERLCGKKVRLNIHEIREPELDAYLVARNIASQMEHQISYRRAIKRSMLRTMQAGAKGRQGDLQRAPGRGRDRAAGHVQGRPGAPAHAAGRYRLWVLRGAHACWAASAARSGYTRATCLPRSRR